MFGLAQGSPAEGRQGRVPIGAFPPPPGFWQPGVGLCLFGLGILEGRGAQVAEGRPRWVREALPSLAQRAAPGWENPEEKRAPGGPSGSRSPAMGPWSILWKQDHKDKTAGLSVVVVVVKRLSPFFLGDEVLGRAKSSLVRKPRGVSISANPASSPSSHGSASGVEARGFS